MPSNQADNKRIAEELFGYTLADHDTAGNACVVMPIGLRLLPDYGGTGDGMLALWDELERQGYRPEFIGTHCFVHAEKNGSHNCETEWEGKHDSKPAALVAATISMLDARKAATDGK